MSAVHLFVYGSLRRDASGTSHPLLAAARFAGDATARGVLYQVEWYPGLVLDGDGTVRGELYEIPFAVADSMIARLDDYEGGGYRRERARVLPAAGAAVEAWVYVYGGPTHTLTPIASGDFGPPAHRARP